MENLAEKVLPIVKSSRSITLPNFGKAEILGFKSESAHDAFTKIDQDTENYLKEKLAEAFPDIPFVGEEYGGDKNVSRFWIADPIDGTGLYIRGIPFCTTMLALIENGQVIFSVIYDFVADVMYHAEKGKGAFRNGEKISVNTRSAQNSYIGWETHLDKDENLGILKQLRGMSNLFKTMCCGYEYAMIAEGRLEGRVTFDPYGNDYDYAPGSLLVAEAGGVVCNVGKTTYDFRDHNFIAGNAELYKKLTSGPDALFPIK